MALNNLQAVILAAGRSSRFNTEKTKLAASICGQAMILFPTKLLEQLDVPTCVVVGFQQEIVKNIISTEHGNTIQFVTQNKQQGTGHALACTKNLWQQKHILVMNGDAPLITAGTVAALYETHIKNNAAISFVTTFNTDTTNQTYGRVVKTDTTVEIVEAKDFIGNTTDQYPINAGVYLINKNFLENYIATLNTNNASKEFYITDLVKIASDHHLNITTVSAPFDTVRGINTFQELLTVEHIVRTERLTYWMNNGVQFSLPHTVAIDLEVTIGQGSSIGSGVHLLGNTIIGKNCTIAEFSSLQNVLLENNIVIHSHCVIKDTHIQSQAEIGPFAHIRSNTTIGTKSIIGNFVEVKNSSIGQDTKAKHLTYIGDATIGSNVNIGAGTITCNYDGINKHKTIINNNAFIGSNNTLIAPITIGNNAFTGAGSTLTNDVPDNALAIARAHQINKNNYVKKLKIKSATSFSFLGARVIHPESSKDDQ